MRFLAKAFKHSKLTPGVYAIYVPKNVILYYKIDPKKYADTWYNAGMISVRETPDDDFGQVLGDVGNYSSRNTLRIQFSHHGELSGKVLEFQILKNRFETSDS